MFGKIAQQDGPLPRSDWCCAPVQRPGAPVEEGLGFRV